MTWTLYIIIHFNSGIAIHSEQYDSESECIKWMIRSREITEKYDNARVSCFGEVK